MNVALFLGNLKTRGVDLYLEGDRLLYHGQPGAMTPDLRSQINAQRAEVIALLQRRATGACADCGATGMTVMLEMDDGSFLCRRCYTGAEE